MTEKECVYYSERMLVVNSSYEIDKIGLYIIALHYNILSEMSTLRKIKIPNTVREIRKWYHCL